MGMLIGISGCCEFRVFLVRKERGKESVSFFLVSYLGGSYLFKGIRMIFRINYY